MDGLLQRRLAGLSVGAVRAAERFLVHEIPDLQLFPSSSEDQSFAAGRDLSVECAREQGVKSSVAFDFEPTAFGGDRSAVGNGVQAVGVDVGVDQSETCFASTVAGRVADGESVDDGDADAGIAGGDGLV